MASPTNPLLTAIWNEREPEATAAFERLADDHGRLFMMALRDQLLAEKHLRIQEVEIAMLHRKNPGRKKAAGIPTP